MTLQITSMCLLSGGMNCTGNAEGFTPKCDTNLTDRKCSSYCQALTKNSSGFTASRTPTAPPAQAWRDTTVPQGKYILFYLPGFHDSHDVLIEVCLSKSSTLAVPETVIWTWSIMWAPSLPSSTMEPGLDFSYCLFQNYPQSSLKKKKIILMFLICSIFSKKEKNPTFWKYNMASTNEQEL
jgi:hypothetical protein